MTKTIINDEIKKIIEFINFDTKYQKILINKVFLNDNLKDQIEILKKEIEHHEKQKYLFISTKQIEANSIKRGKLKALLVILKDKLTPPSLETEKNNNIENTTNEYDLVKSKLKQNPIPDVTYHETVDKQQNIIIKIYHRKQPNNYKVFHYLTKNVIYFARPYASMFVINGKQDINYRAFIHCPLTKKMITNYFITKKEYNALFKTKNNGSKLKKE